MAMALKNRSPRPKFHPTCGRKWTNHSGTILMPLSGAQENFKQLLVCSWTLFIATRYLSTSTDPARAQGTLTTRQQLIAISDATVVPNKPRDSLVECSLQSSLAKHASGGQARMGPSSSATLILGRFPF